MRLRTGAFSVVTKGLTRNISKKAALSYKRSRPNPIGVTSIAAVNGRGAHARAFRAVEMNVVRPNRASSSHARSADYDERYHAAHAELRKNARGEERIMHANKRKKPRTAAQKAATKKMIAGNRKRARARHGGTSVVKHKRKGGTVKRTARKGTRRITARKTVAAKFRPLTVRVGGKTRKTYLYKTRKGGARHIPEHVIMGFSSKAAMKAALAGAAPDWNPKKKAAFEKRRAKALRTRERIIKARDRASDRVEVMGDMFTPNVRTIPYEEWSQNPMFKSNKKRKGAKKRKGGAKKRRSAAQKATTKKMIRAAARKRAGKSTRRVKHKRKKSHAKRRVVKHTRRAAPKRRRASPKRRRVAMHTRRAAPKRRRASPKRRRVAMHRAQRAIALLYKTNRRRRHTKRHGFKRNGYLAWLKEGLKMGALVGVGFFGHKALTKLLSDEALGKIDALKDGTTAGKYRGLIAGAATAVAAIFLSGKFLPKYAMPIAAGSVLSLIQKGVMLALTEADQPKAAAYLAGFDGYADNSGRAYGEYFTSGMSGYGGFGYPAITQAAAGMGMPMLSQAAAGTGEYMAEGVQGIGDYEMVSPEFNGYGGFGAMNEGIPGADTYAAERALTIAEAAAGIGDIPTRSQQDPVAQLTRAIPVHDVPGGMRAGTFQGRDGIFG